MLSASLCLLACMQVLACHRGRNQHGVHPHDAGVFLCDAGDCGDADPGDPPSGSAGTPGHGHGRDSGMTGADGGPDEQPEPAGTGSDAGADAGGSAEMDGSAGAAGEGGPPSAAGSGGSSDEAGTGGSDPEGMAGTTGGETGAGAGAGAGGAGVGGAGAGGAGAGAGGAGGAGAGGEGGAGGASVEPKRPWCVSEGSQGLLLGDQYVNYINNLQPLVTQRAIADGALSAGQRYRDVAVAGTSLNYGLGPIPTQWSGVRDTDVRFVVMTGGLNDIIINNSYCLEVDAELLAACQMVIGESIATLQEIWLSMKANRVRDVVYFYYPHIPYGGMGIIDDSSMRVKEACESQNGPAFRCHFIDLRPIFDGKPSYIGIDLIHPTAAGAAAIADEIYRVMKANCVGQQATSGCCDE